MYITLLQYKRFIRTIRSIITKDIAGISFLDECYEAEHQQTVETAIEDLATVCKIHGGELSY